ncbi:hypothetical protein [Photorhabdus khanii]|uniref:Uncharacterized protein n=1 Tax=Photorhabdus khanii subsp. guanajuatensis TaxID=2100166 RepID=A0A4R4JIX5_9GAMM|nr:hypothetical protein [Photorhabdus khanii]TDB53351.1 hypothetical protein C5467_15410 [Photorhabdus khanii subsp. guanajuatensis]
MKFADIKTIIEKDINELDLADVSIDTLTIQESYIPQSQFIRRVDNILLGNRTFPATVRAYPGQVNYVRQLPQKAIDQITEQFAPALCFMIDRF